tara:strand:+ start:231 stop:506 length:276 start_codon:yes stop_codon:yes gene_type:complete
MGPVMFLSKRRQRRIEEITKNQWDQVSLIRHDKMRGNDAGDVRARAIKAISRDYEVGSVIGSILFALAVKFAAKLIEQWLKDHLMEQVSDE